MKAIIELNFKKVHVDFSKGEDISIPLIFNGNQPNTYDVPKASAKPYSDNSFIGDIRRGGPCNFETVNLTPHCNGTHTECIGHITEKRISIIESLKEELIPSFLITIEPCNAEESYVPQIMPEDLVISKKKLKEKLENVSPAFLQALIIRTTPNHEDKKNRNYMKKPSCFFTIEAMNYIVSLGVKHLLVDIPSVDRLFDDGILSGHNIFWETEEKKFNNDSKEKTITEMIFVPNEILDGKYLLNLQIAPFVLDASPSRPVIYQLNEL
tara:strand:- start:2707 stop:3507 length:801 start_codon:yes stop_codon:yes gene_type:complete